MENIKKFVVGAAGTITALFGWVGWLTILYCFAMASDYVTGTAVAVKQKKWNSSVARTGLWKKCGSIIAVLVSGMTDLLLGLIINNFPSLHLPFTYGVLISPIVLLWYTITEIGSIIENAAKMGASIPPFLNQILAVLKKTLENTDNTKRK